MKIGTAWTTRGLLLLLATAAVGCGQGFKSGSTTESTAQKQLNVDEELKQAEKATIEAQEAMALALAAIADISDSRGNINIGLFTRGKNAKVNINGILTPLADHLRPLFDKVYDKLAMVKEKYNTARAALADAIAKLDATDPAQARLIAELESSMQRLDSFEGQFRGSIQRLAGKLNLASSGLDKVVRGVTSFIPGFGWLASFALDYFIMDDLKGLIFEFQQKLMAL